MGGRNYVWKGFKVMDLLGGGWFIPLLFPFLQGFLVPLLPLFAIPKKFLLVKSYS